MQFAVLFIAIILSSFQSLFTKLYSDSFSGKPELATPVFGVFEGVAIGFISLVFMGFKFSASPVTLMLGALNAAILFLYNISYISACKRGSYAFMNMMMLFGGILVPLIYTEVFTDDPALGLLKYGAIGVMLIACVLMNIEGIKLGKVRISYYVFCLLLFFTNGVYGTVLKIQEVSVKGEGSELITITYAIMGIISLVRMFISEKPADIASAFKLNKKNLIYLILCLLSIGIVMNMIVWMLTFIDAGIVFTVDNGGVLMLSALYSIIFFKEKPTVPKVTGMLCALASLIVLSI